MSRSENLPTLPQAASNVLRLADDTDVNPREIERAIEMDPAITAKILKVANSAYYGSIKVPTLSRAISFLGMTSVRSVVISIAMQQMVSGKNHCPSLNKIELWRHSLATAIGCRIIGKLRNPGKSEELYCAGMMHEIGLLAMDKFVPNELHSAIQRARDSHGDLIEIENDVLGFSHADAGKVLGKRWNLSPLLQYAIEFWPDPYLADEYFETTAVVSIAKAIANTMGFKHSGLECNSEVNVLVAQEIGLPEAQFGIIGDVVAQEVARAQETFQIAA